LSFWYVTVIGKLLPCTTNSWIAGDDICKGGDDIGISHLNYSLDAGTAAMFALGSAGAKLGITSQRMRPANGGLGG
jgi:cutinase